ncbi:hypothetical protein FBQ96_06250, partial [Nitrospirales bacterium NOB]|nr:hypothetical protein [Nitrospirales bacterium NOB]
RLPDYRIARWRGDKIERLTIGTEADARAAGNLHVAVDDDAAQPGVPAHADPRHEDALLDPAEAVHPHVRTEYAAHHRAARDDAARRDDGVQRQGRAKRIGP